VNRGEDVLLTTRGNIYIADRNWVILIFTIDRKGSGRPVPINNQRKREMG